MRKNLMTEMMKSARIIDVFGKARAPDLFVVRKKTAKKQFFFEHNINKKSGTKLFIFSDIQLTIAHESVFFALLALAKKSGKYQSAGAVFDLQDEDFKSQYEVDYEEMYSSKLCAEGKSPQLEVLETNLFQIMKNAGIAHSERAVSNVKRYLFELNSISYHSFTDISAATAECKATAASRWKSEDIEKAKRMHFLLAKKDKSTEEQFEFQALSVEFDSLTNELLKQKLKPIFKIVIDDKNKVKLYLHKQLVSLLYKKSGYFNINLEDHRELSKKHTAKALHSYLSSTIQVDKHLFNGKGIGILKLATKLWGAENEPKNKTELNKQLIAAAADINSFAEFDCWVKNNVLYAHRHSVK